MGSCQVRQWLGACLVAVAAFNPFAASGQEFPSRPITIIDTFAAGGNTDFQARLMAPELAKLLGQTVIVENRPGASGAVALEYLTTSLPAERLTPTTKSRKKILHLRERNLSLTFATSRMLGKNIEDQPGSVNHFDFDDTFQLS